MAHTKFFIYISGTNLRKGKDNSEINKMFPCGTEKYTDTGMNLFNSHIYTNSNETMLRTHTKKTARQKFFRYFLQKLGWRSLITTSEISLPNTSSVEQAALMSGTSTW